MFVVLRCWFVVGVLSSISVTGYSGGGVSITCKYERKYTENAKYFCRGQWSECTDQIKTEEKNKWVHSEIFSLYDDTRAAVFTVTIRDLSERDSGTYQCGVDIYAKVDSYTEVNLNNVINNHSYIAVSLLYHICATVKTAVKEVSHTGCDYEEIKYTHKQLPKTPSNSSNTVYATAQLPTNPSVSSSSVYATVQKATGDSEILITSAEDLNYAVVNFHKKADCPDSVRLRNNQDYSEYAAVNHLTA
uniref:Ig-like domain-containing protein n=1 Tax=Sinocyclocheilus grahami TaxID=75366 RepID=A0A672MHZ0_SINGR